MDNMNLYLQEYSDIVEDIYRRLISVEQTDSISEMVIFQMGILLNGGIELASHFLQFSINEDLTELSLESIRFYESILERMMRSFERCSLITDSNNDILIYDRSFNYITDMMINDMINISDSNSIEEYYLKTMIIFNRVGVFLARNALRFRLCRELIDILRELVIFMSTSIKNYENITLN